MVIIHLNLRQPMTINGKLTSDVQFYTDVGKSEQDTYTDKNMTDEQAMDLEDQEIHKVDVLKDKFQTFCVDSEPIVQTKNAQFEWDVPYETVTFEGSINSARVILNVSKFTLVCLTEWPPVIIAVDDVDLVCVERYTPLEFTSKSFDLNFIGKDLKTVTHVSSIPSNQYEKVREWTQEVDVLFVVTKQSLEWTKLLKDIRSDLQSFVDNKAWTPFVDMLEGPTLHEDCTQSANKKNNFDSQAESEDVEFLPSNSDGNSSEEEYSSSDDDEFSDDES